MAKTSAKNSDADRILALLCYVLWPIGIVLLLMEKQQLRYHSINGLGFGVAWLVLSAILSILFWFLWPVVGIVNLAVFVYAIIIGVQAYNGEEPEIPLVTELLRKNVKGF